MQSMFLKHHHHLWLRSRNKPSLISALIGTIEMMVFRQSIYIDIYLDHGIYKRKLIAHLEFAPQGFRHKGVVHQEHDATRSYSDAFQIIFNLLKDSVCFTRSSN